jgi:GNAT superfamily N-acetyltransferase
MFDVRPMTDADVERCELVWDDAYRTMRVRHDLPVAPRTLDQAQLVQRRIHHLLATDPAGAVVAVVDGEVAGFAQALVRDDLWVLSLFGVAPTAQGRGIGRAVLTAALECGDGRRGMIMVSRDPIAMRRYFHAGFDLHPAFVAHGPVQSDRLPPSPGVRSATASDAPLVKAVDLAVRGASHAGDIAFLQSEGTELLVHDDGGYALVTHRPVLVAATSPAVATELLAAALRRAPAGEAVDFSWVTAPQQWALRVALDAGMELHPMGPMGLRGFAAPPTCYLPTGAFG